jgi:hypothetical protein
LTDVSNYTARFLSSFLSIHNTGVGMPEPLRNTLANYLKTNSVQPTLAPNGVALDPALLYDSNCALCHGAFRQGGLGGPNITGNQITNFTTEARLSTFIEGHFTGIDLDQSRRDILAEWLKSSP